MFHLKFVPRTITTRRDATPPGSLADRVAISTKLEVSRWASELQLQNNGMT
jgi:hypothetical protein